MRITTKAVFQMHEDGSFEELERESYEYDGPIAESKGGGSTQTIQKADPWSGQQPFLKEIFGEAQSQYGGLPTQYYPGYGFTPMNQLEQAGLRSQLEYGTGPQSQQYQNMGTSALSQMLNAPSTGNPFMQQYGNQLAQQMGRDFSEQILPGIKSRSIGAGQLGSSRQGIAEGLAAERAADAMGRMRSGLMADMYDKGLAQQARGMAFLPQIQQMGFQPGRTMQSIGGQLRGEQDKYLQDDVSRWYAAMGMPRQDLANYMSTIQGNYGGTTSTSGQQGGSGGLGGALGGGLSGLSLASALSSPGGIGLFGGTPTIAGLGSMGTMGLYGLGGALLGSMFG